MHSCLGVQLFEARVEPLSWIAFIYRCRVKLAISLSAHISVRALVVVVRLNDLALELP
jgi:hypothetical protein